MYTTYIPMDTFIHTYSLASRVPCAKCHSLRKVAFEGCVSIQQCRVSAEAEGRALTSRSDNGRTASPP